MSKTIGEAVKLAYEHEIKINDILANYVTTDTYQEITAVKYFRSGKLKLEENILVDNFEFLFPHNSGTLALLSDVNNLSLTAVKWIDVKFDYYPNTILCFFNTYNANQVDPSYLLQSAYVALTAATTSKAGILTASDKVKINNIASDIAAALNTANSYTDSKTNRTYLVNTIGEATTSQFGLLSAADKIKINNIAGDISTALNAAKTYTDSKVARENLVAVLGEATTTLNGLMSATDKERLNTLYALLGESADPDQFVNTISEILEVFETYPEGADIATILAGKINYSDVVDNLNSNETVKPLSANQGRILKGMVDQKVSSYSNDPTQWDTTPTSGSTKPVTSGGVKAADDALAADIAALDGRTDNLEDSVAGLETTKADKATTYTKDEIDASLNELDGEINNLETTKADKSTTYTKDETDGLLATKQPIGNYATLENGKIPSSQLPSYVDDVLEYASISQFPVQGENGVIYIALDTNKTYRWSGTDYVEISKSLALGETSSTAYAGDKGKANADAITVLQGDVTNIKNGTTHLFENITDKHGNPRFVEGDITMETITGVTQTYGKWSLSGSHLMIVIAGSVENGTTLTSNTDFAFITFPQFIFNKISPIVAGGSTIDVKTISYYQSYSSVQTAPTRLLFGTSNTIIIKNSANITFNTNRSFRIQFDCLIDDE